MPGTLEPAPVDRPDRVESIIADAEAIGFPLLVKAAAGGGGRGMRRVERAQDLPAALVAGSSEALAAFGDGSVYLEREIRPARHIEVQLLGDVTGRVVAIGERDCSLQRRHQKLVEEAPAPGLTAGPSDALHEMAVRVATAAGLRNAATAEFLRSPDGSFYFLEVNTRLQVEHGVTELVSGLDIVREQFWLAAGAPAVRRGAGRPPTHAAEPTSHAIEVRLSAEDPARDFAPTPGRVRRWVMPSGPGVRVDTALEAGERVPAEYDNLIAKIMVHAGDRADGHRPAASGARRDRGQRHPDDAAVPPARGPRCELPGRATCPPAGWGSTGTVRPSCGAAIHAARLAAGLDAITAGLAVGPGRRAGTDPVTGRPSQRTATASGVGTGAPPAIDRWPA